ncbi:FRG domain-containing protein [uncultured Traorella sp.]|uniref:FRG domain-containing protein n=1 Tax=uncultured Traorella sp. TaxID=1929048 RepID=UPI0025E8B4F5|nr:FRG domain-containing protein [uncultured Traorella sp.]
MAEEIYIKKIEDIIGVVLDQKYDVRIDRHRSSFLYRGLPNDSFTLTTSIERNCKEKWTDLEKPILRNFTKYAAMHMPDLKDSVWKQLIIGQHHGLPTRLLDWTYSPLIAMHFATSGEHLHEMDEHNGLIWKIDIEELNLLLPQKYQEALNREKAYLFTTDMMRNVVHDLESYDKDMSDQSMVFLEPPSFDERIINQYSYFSVVPKNIGCIEDFLDKYTHKTVKYIIDKDLRWEIRDMLDRLNINERIIFPDLDGLSNWLKRHYFVKESR